MNFGFRRTLPHLAGVVLGFCLMAALIGCGLDAAFARFPALPPAMRRALSHPRVARRFNLTMAALLALSIVPALFE